MKKLLVKTIAVAALSLVSMIAIAEDRINVAFVDSGNTGRSVTAEALANKWIGQKNVPIYVISRAVNMNPYNVIPEPYAAKLLGDEGMDVSNHRAVQLVKNDIAFSTIILTMTAKHRDAIIEQFPEAKSKVFLLAEYATGNSVDVVDAWQKPMEVYQQVFTQLKEYVPATLSKLMEKKASK